MASTSSPVITPYQNHLWIPSQPIRFAPTKIRDTVDGRWRAGTPLVFADKTGDTVSRARHFSSAALRHAPRNIRHVVRPHMSDARLQNIHGLVTVEEDKWSKRQPNARKFKGQVPARRETEVQQFRSQCNELEDKAHTIEKLPNNLNIFQQQPFQSLGPASRHGNLERLYMENVKTDLPLKFEAMTLAVDNVHPRARSFSAYGNFKPSSPKHAPYSGHFSSYYPANESSDHQFDPPPSQILSEMGHSEVDPESTSGEDSSDPDPNSETASVSDAESGSEDESDSSSEAEPQALGEDEIYTPLEFQIPADTMREAMLASPGTPASFWSHKLYRGPADEKVTVHYCRSKDTGETVAKLFLGKPVLGFDVEWKSQANAAAGLKSNVSLIQLACENRVGLFHIALYKGETPEEILPPTLREIIASPDVLKAGVAILNDFSRVAKFLDTKARGVIELSHWHRLVTYSEHNPELVNKKLVGLAKQVEIHFQLPLSKGDVRTSDWSKQLNHEQCTYAAADAYASYRLYEALEEKRIAMRPRPPRPQFAELKMPIKLADRLIAESLSDEDLTEVVDEAEEFSGGLDNLTLSPSRRSQAMDENISDEELLSIESAAQCQEVEDLTKESSDTVKNANLSPFDDSIDSSPARLIGRVRLSTSAVPTTSAPIKTRAPRKSSTPKSTSPTQSTEDLELLAAATTWAGSQSQDKIPTPSPPHHREGRKGSTWLKCYYLWHHEGLELEDVARILRSPSLKKATVANYIAEAVGYGGCEFGDLERLRGVLDVVPMQAWGRFRVLRRKVEDALKSGGKAQGTEKDRGVVGGEDEDQDQDQDQDEWVV